MSRKKNGKVTNFYGWDIGGAHIKICQIRSVNNSDIIHATQLKCKLWDGLKHLERAIKKLKNIFSFTQGDFHFFTMSGEMVDCFPNRKDGVKKILKVLKNNFRSEIYYYSQDKILKKPKLSDDWQAIASSNWHATTKFVSSHVEAGILIDIGSTTTDLIPINNYMTVTEKISSDALRLQRGELVYLGITRTPVSSIKPRFTFKNRSYNVMRELFANTADVFRITKELSKDMDLYPTCDNQDKTVTSSERRLARVIGMDWEEASSEEWELFAKQIKRLMIRELDQNIRKIKKKLFLSSQVPLIITGSGAFLAKQLCEQYNYKYFFFHELINKQFKSNASQIDNINKCAPAVSLAIMAKNI